MESLEMIKTEKNGQLFIDWESLELLTTKELVDNIQHFIDFTGEPLKNIKVIKRSYGIDVYLNLGASILFYDFDIRKREFHLSVLSKMYLGEVLK